MTLLERACLALYGRAEGAHKALRADLGLTSPNGRRAFRRFMAGSQDIPEGLVRDVETLLRDRAMTIDSLLERLAEAPQS